MRFGILLLLVIGTTGCADRPVHFYLFGPAKSCFPISDRSQCDKLKVYDKVELRVFGEKQEVVYVQQAIGLDQTNTIFKKLNGCKVVSRDSFSCEGLVRSDGRFTDTSTFRGLTVSQSYWPALTSQYAGSTIKRGTVQFFHKHAGWLDSVLTVFSIIMALALIGSALSRT